MLTNNEICFLRLLLAITADTKEFEVAYLKYDDADNIPYRKIAKDLIKSGHLDVREYQSRRYVSVSDRGRHYLMVGKL